MWKQHPARAELFALYAEVDAMLDSIACPASTDCCHFDRTGREPYPHAVELAEVEDAVRALGRPPKALPVQGRCPLLGRDGRCRIYASRPFGCRTYFCERAHVRSAPDAPASVPRERVREIGRRIADLSARAFPRDPGPRALTKSLGAR